MLFLKMHIPYSSPLTASMLNPQASQGALRESDVEAVLKKIPIKAGAGKLKVMND